MIIGIRYNIHICIIFLSLYIYMYTYEFVSIYVYIFMERVGAVDLKYDHRYDIYVYSYICIYV
jgi:hypothetical protein